MFTAEDLEMLQESGVFNCLNCIDDCEDCTFKNVCPEYEEKPL